MIKFRMPLLAVRDVEISKKFFTMIYSIRRLCWILGGNVTFSGYAVQQDF